MEPVTHEEVQACGGGLVNEHANECAKAAGMWGTPFLQVSGFGFTEEEKDDGLTMSVVSSEGAKSPPNGDHVEAQAAQTAWPPKPGGSSELL